MNLSNCFQELSALNVNDKTEKKKTGGAELTYLSWPYAWAEVKKRYPDVSYTIWKDEKNRPYTYDPDTGYMVYTTVTIGGITHEMWLPVMDGANNAMKAVPYQISTKYKTYEVKAATMFDINKTIMRCLVKNLAMFGLGLYIFAGEDLPDNPDEGQDKKNVDPKPDPVKAGPDPAKVEAPTCALCGETIKPFRNKGVVVSAEEFVQRTMNKFDKPLCKECVKLINGGKDT